MSSQAKIILSAEDRTAAAFASVMRGASQVGFSLDTLKAGAVGVLSALAVPVSVAGIANVFNEARRAVDGMKDLADASGSSVEAISALDNIARSTGGNLDTVSAILVKFNAALSDADPSKGAGAMLKAIGLSVEDLKRMDPAEALRVTAVAVEQLGSETDKARVYQELFGKSVRDAAPFLKDLADAKRLDATLTAEQIEEVDRFNKEMSKLEASASNVARALSIQVAGALNIVIDRFREGKKEGKGFWDIALEGYRKDVADVYGNIFGLAEPKNIGNGRMASGPIVDPTDPRAALRKIERQQDTRPKASVLPPVIQKPPSQPRGGGRDSADAPWKGLSYDEQITQRVGKLLEDSDLTKAKEYADTLKRLDELYFAGAMDGDLYNSALQKLTATKAQAGGVSEELAAKINEELDGAADRAKRLGDAFASTFDRAFTDGMELGDLLKKLAWDAINIQFLTPATQKAGNWLGTALSGLFSFDGGGYTGSGSRSGGLDGKGGFLAVMHPDETVLDHTRGQVLVGGGGSSVNVSYSIDARGADPGVEQRLRTALAESEARLRATIVPTVMQASRRSTGVARALRGG